MVSDQASSGGHRRHDAGGEHFPFINHRNFAASENVYGSGRALVVVTALMHLFDESMLRDGPGSGARQNCDRPADAAGSDGGDQNSGPGYRGPSRGGKAEPQVRIADGSSRQVAPVNHAGASTFGATETGDTGHLGIRCGCYMLGDEGASETGGSSSETRDRNNQDVVGRGSCGMRCTCQNRRCKGCQHNAERGARSDTPQA